MRFFLDIAVVIIMILSIIVCYKKGIIHTLVSFVGNIVCIIASLFFGDSLANRIYDNILRTQILDSISDSLENSSYDGITSVEQAISRLPGLPKDLLTVFGHSSKSIAKGIKADLHNDIPVIAGQIEKLLHPICLAIISFIVVFILFIGFRILYHFLIRLVDRLTDLPVLRTVNRVFGGVFGIVNGFALIYFLVGIFSLIFPFIAGENMTLAEFDKIALETNFYSFFYRDNLITAMFM